MNEAFPHLQTLQEEMLQKVLPNIQGALKQALTYTAPVHADGISGKEIPNGISNGSQCFQARHIYQQATDASANVLLTP